MGYMSDQQFGVLALVMILVIIGLVVVGIHLH